MKRIDRLVAIVLLLQSRRLIRAQDIADHFGISVGTVYRDLLALQEAGVPLAAEAGEGYSLVAGYHLPPVMFTPEEASALFVGAEFVQHLTDASLKKKNVESAPRKIRAVLPEDKQEYLERLQQATAVPAHPACFEDGFRDDVLTMMQEAVVRRRYFFGVAEEAAADGGVIVTFVVPAPDVLVSWLFSLREENVMFVIVWQFEVLRKHAAEFEKQYGSTGAWAQFFSRSDDFPGTRLLRDAEQPHQYFTLDFWKSEAAFQEFKKRRRKPCPSNL